MRIKNKWNILCASALLSITASCTAYGQGWTVDASGGGLRYENEDGTWPVSQWQQIDGKWYHFDENGFMETGWYENAYGQWFWMDGNGVMVSGTIRQIDGKIYRVNADGCCTEDRNYSGWLEDGFGWWFRNPDGTWPAAEWALINDEWYHFDEKGYVQSGWYEENGIRYWLNETGKMLRNTDYMVDGMNYHFDENGAASAMVKGPVVIPPEDQKTELEHAVDAMADQVLARIINDGMNDHQKAAAIYRWVRGNLTYSASSGSIGDWPTAAYEGFRRKRGHCYTYYSVSLALLSRAGIPSVEVIRATDHDHWWNLVYVDGVWLHFDTTPRRLGGDFCLLTTAQLLAYSNTHGNSHVFDVSQYPATP